MVRGPVDVKVAGACDAEVLDIGPNTAPVSEM